MNGKETMTKHLPRRDKENSAETEVRTYEEGMEEEINKDANAKGAEKNGKRRRRMNWSVS